MGNLPIHFDVIQSDVIDFSQELESPQRDTTR